jgi:hypothetical protein
MKKITRLLFLAGAVTLFAINTGKAQEIVLRARLHAPVVAVRPPAPSPRHVWIGEEWTPSGGTYAYKGGYWAEPPRPHARWIPGHWRQTPRGWVWRPGHWR